MHKKFFDEQGLHIVDQPQYSFLFDKSHPKYIGRPLSFLTVSGSIAYGTDIETSDVDLRGFALQRPEEILGMSEWEGMPSKHHKVPDGLDVAVYGYNKLFKLLLKCNPNMLEILCVKDEHILIEDYAANLIRKNHRLFLSRKALHGAFTGYSNAQLRRLQNSNTTDEYVQTDKEVHIQRSIENAARTINERYLAIDSDCVTFDIIPSTKTDYETEVGISLHLDKYPVRDVKGMLSEFGNVIRDYDKLNTRNKKKDDAHLSKHMMHLIRPILMEIHAHKTGELVVYMDEHIPLLRAIRAGDYMNEDSTVKKEFYDMLDKIQAECDEAYEHSVLPDKPDLVAIEKLLMEINKYSLEMLDNE